MMRKTILQYECCKSMLTTNIFVKWLYNSDKINSSMLYRDNVQSGGDGYQAPWSMSLTQLRTNVHWLHKVTQGFIK